MERMAGSHNRVVDGILSIPSPQLDKPYSNDLVDFCLDKIPGPELREFILEGDWNWQRDCVPPDEMT